VVLPHPPTPFVPLPLSFHFSGQVSGQVGGQEEFVLKNATIGKSAHPKIDIQSKFNK